MFLKNYFIFKKLVKLQVFLHRYNAKQMTNNSKFNRCKSSILDYMSLKAPAKIKLNDL